MDFLKHQASYCDVIKYKKQKQFDLFIYVFFFLLRSVVEKHEQLVEDNTKQETTLVAKRTQRDAYVCLFKFCVYIFFDI